MMSEAWRFGKKRSTSYVTELSSLSSCMRFAGGGSMSHNRCMEEMLFFVRKNGNYVCCGVKNDAVKLCVSKEFVHSASVQCFFVVLVCMYFSSFDIRTL